MSHYKLFIESNQVTLVDTETGRQETWGVSSPSDTRPLQAVFKCKLLGIHIDIKDEV